MKCVLWIVVSEYRPRAMLRAQLIESGRRPFLGLGCTSGRFSSRDAQPALKVEISGVALETVG